MAWDAPRRRDPLPRALGSHISFVDELDLHKPSLEQLEHFGKDACANMPAQLSPVQEECRSLSLDAPLVVHVTARFHDPAIRFTYEHTYHSSRDFTPSDRLCRGLVRRIEHCSIEFITRKDSDALHVTRCLRKGPKPMRFELSFQVSRQGHAGVWAERSFASYQKHALTVHSANEVLRSTHTIVGLFLRRHDKAFQWTDEPGYEYFPDKPETFTPSLKGPLSLACVPRSHFIESSQTWEFVPGYSLELSFTSRNPARHQIEISRTLKVDSEQNTPLNLGMGEDLLWQAYRSLQDVLDQKKSSFDLEHAACDGFDGVPDCDCQHFEQHALSVGLRVVNNLGPMYDHLNRSIQSSLRLFTHQSGQDCDNFVAKVQTRLQQFRARTDKKLERLNDFDLRIAELTGHGWQQKNCARFIIDGNQNHTRRGTQALLDRIRNGVSDVLRGNDVAIRMIAYKRGHLVLDKALVARDHKSAPGHGSSDSVDFQQHLILAELKRRIQQDIDMLCQDTCDVDEKLLEIFGHEGEVCSPRPRLSQLLTRPLTPWNTSTPRSHRAGSGSPATLATQSPISPARCSPRIFPLVPTKVKEKKALESTTAAFVKDQEDTSIWNRGSRRLDAVFDEEPLKDIGGPIAPEGKGKGIIRNADTQGLRPAAEVYRLSKGDYDTDASSTHSSMPALTESDTPSPDHSLLITPTCMRSSSPISRGRSSVEEFNYLHFSDSFLRDTSAPNSKTFSDSDRLESPKMGALEQETLPSARTNTPKRPSVEGPVAEDVAKDVNDASRDEKTPLAHRHMQGITKANGLVDNGIIGETSAANTEDNGSETTGPDPMSHHLYAGIDSEAATRDLTSSWLLYPVKEEDTVDLTPNVTHQVSTIATSPAKCDLSNKDGTLPSHGKTSEHVSQLSVPTEQVELCPGTKAEQWQVKDQDEVTAMASRKVEISEFAERGMGKSETPHIASGHLIPLSDSGIDLRTGSEATDKSGSEYDEKLILSPIYERRFDFGSLNIDCDLGVSLAQSGTELSSALEPLCNANPPVDLSMNETEAPECSVVDIIAVTETIELAPKQSPAAIKLPKVRISNPSSRSISNPQPSPTHLGLGSAHLLPSLPIFSSLRSVSHDTRASWASSSSWEDYVSSVRQSSDSVDTFKPSPTSSEDDHRNSTKRLGTPTAGLLGLNEPRWAEFGIRTALTGTHAFDRPTTPMSSETPESSYAIATPDLSLYEPEEKENYDRPSAPRKSLLKQKKSIGSMIMASRLKRKESKELRKQKSVELKSLKKTRSRSRGSPVSREDGTGAGRFPKAMMLVAGLAFASSVISQNRS